MKKEINKQLNCELRWAEKRYPNQQMPLWQWLDKISKKTRDAVEWLQTDPKGYRHCSGSTFGYDDEFKSVLFAVMAMALRGLEQHGVSDYFLQKRYKFFIQNGLCYIKELKEVERRIKRKEKTESRKRVREEKERHERCRACKCNNCEYKSDCGDDW